MLIAKAEGSIALSSRRCNLLVIARKNSIERAYKKVIDALVPQTDRETTMGKFELDFRSAEEENNFYETIDLITNAEIIFTDVNNLLEGELMMYARKKITNPSVGTVPSDVQAGKIDLFLRRVDEVIRLMSFFQHSGRMAFGEARKIRDEYCVSDLSSAFAREKMADVIVKRELDKTLRAAKRLLDIFLDNDAGRLEFKIGGVNQFVFSLSDEEFEFWASLSSLWRLGFRKLNQRVDGELFRYALKKIIGTETIKSGERAREEILGRFANQFDNVVQWAHLLNESAEDLSMTAAELRRDFCVDLPVNPKVDEINPLSEHVEGHVEGHVEIEPHSIDPPLGKGNDKRKPGDYGVSCSGV